MSLNKLSRPNRARYEQAVAAAYQRGEREPDQLMRLAEQAVVQRAQRNLKADPLKLGGVRDYPGSGGKLDLGPEYPGSGGKLDMELPQEELLERIRTPVHRAFDPQTVGSMQALAGTVAPPAWVGEVRDPKAPLLKVQQLADKKVRRSPHEANAYLSLEEQMGLDPSRPFYTLSPEERAAALDPNKNKPVQEPRAGYDDPMLNAVYSKGVANAYQRGERDPDKLLQAGIADAEGYRREYGRPDGSVQYLPMPGMAASGAERILPAPTPPPSDGRPAGWRELPRLADDAAQQDPVYKLAFEQASQVEGKPGIRTPEAIAQGRTDTARRISELNQEYEEIERGLRERRSNPDTLYKGLSEIQQAVKRQDQIIREVRDLNAFQLMMEDPAQARFNIEWDRKSGLQKLGTGTGQALKAAAGSTFLAAPKIINDLHRAAAGVFLNEEQMRDFRPLLAEGEAEARRIRDEAQAEINRIEQYDKTQGVVANLGVGFFNALPQAFVSLATGGSSIGAQAAEAARSLATSGLGLAPKVAQAAMQMFKDPAFVASMMQIGGSSYVEARDEGASMEQAVAFALPNAFGGAIIEMGGGLEAIRGKGPMTLWQLLKLAPLGEGAEEVQQGMLEATLKKAVYAQRFTDMTLDDLVSLDNQEAVLSLTRAIQEFGGGVALGLVLGGGQQLVGKAIDWAGKVMENDTEVYRLADGSTLTQQVNEDRSLKRLSMEDKDGVTRYWIETRRGQDGLQYEAHYWQDGSYKTEVIDGADIEMLNAQEREAAVEAATGPQEAVTPEGELDVLKEAAEAAVGLASAPEGVQDAGVEVEPPRNADARNLQRLNLEAEALLKQEQTPEVQAQLDQVRAQQRQAAFQAERTLINQRRQAQERYQRLDRQRRQELQGMPEANLQGERPVLPPQNKKSGGVVRAFDSRNYARMSERQKSGISALHSLGQALGQRFVIRESILNEAGHPTNGYYDPKDGTIHLALDAVDQGLMIAAGHELTHRIRREAPEDYRGLLDLIKTLHQEDGSDFDALVQQKMDNYREKGVALDLDGAAEEVAAASMEEFLNDPARAARVVQENPGLARRIIDYLRAFAQKVKDAFRGLQSNSPEAAALREMGDRVEALRDRWWQALEGMAAEAEADSGVPEAWKGQQIGTEAEIATQESVPERAVASMPEAGRGVAYTNDNEPVRFRYAAVPVSELIASNLPNMEPNPDYPAQLQPRERTREASEQQVQRIARRLNPERLGESVEVQNGAPIVGPDMVVESGNGRVMALRSVQGTDQGKAYAKWLKDNAARFGLSPADIQADSVLVRVRESEVNRERFAFKANERTNDAYSPTENAATDARKLTPAMLQLYEANDDGNINTVANHPFILRFMDAVVPRSERGQYVTADGMLSQEGLTRVRNALFQRAYGDAALTAQMSEETDVSVKNVIKAMTNLAPRVVSLSERIKAGQLHALDLAPVMTEAANAYRGIKSAGTTVQDYIGQETMYARESPEAMALMELFENNKRSARAITDAIGSMMDSIEGYGDPRQTTLGGMEVPSLQELVESARGGEQRMYSLDPYTDHQLENWKNSRRIVVYQNPQQLDLFLDKAMKDKAYNAKMYFGRVPTELAARILQETGVDVDGYNLSLSANEVRKILKDHGDGGSEPLRGQRPISMQDFHSLIAVIEEPDAISRATDYVGRPGAKPQPGITFEKTLPNGRTVVFSYVSGKHNDLAVQTMYGWAQKGGLARSPRGSFPFAQTSETHPSTASSESIPEDGHIGNGRAEKDSGVLYSLENPGPSEAFLEVEQQDGEGVHDSGRLLTELFQQARGVRVSDRTVNALAEGLIRKLRSDADPEGVKRNLRAAFDYVEKGRAIDWKHVMSYAQAVVQSVVEQQSVFQEGATAVEGLDPQEAAFVTGMDIFRNAYREKLTRPLVERYEAQLTKVREEWKERRRTAIRETRSSIRERMDSREARNKYIARIDRSAKKLQDWSLNPKKDKYVPEFMRNTVNDLLQSLDMASVRSDGSLRESYRARSWQEALNDLGKKMVNSDALAQTMAVQGADGTFVMSVDPDLATDIEALTEGGKEQVSYRGLNNEQLKQLSSILERTEHAVRTANRLHANRRYQDLDALSLDTISELYNRKQKATESRLDSFFNYDLLDSFSYADRLGSPGKSVIDSLYKEGFGRFVKRAQEGKAFIEQLADKYKDFRAWTGKRAELHGFQVQGGEIHLSTGQLMELYLLNQREQARGHIYGQGIRAERVEARQEGRAVKLRQANPVTVSQADVEQMLKTLTPEQMAAAQEIKAFLTDTLSQWGNEVSMTLYGYQKFTEPDYYPIRSDQNFTLTQDPNANEMLGAIVNLGMTKATVKGASNPIIVSDILDTVSRHISEMANYNAYVVPLNDAMKWFNYRFRDVDERGNAVVRSVKGGMDHALGKPAQRYFINLLKAINGMNNKPVAEGFMGLANQAMARFKTAAVAGNIRVVAQQHGSYLRAAAMVNPAYLTAAYAMNPKRGMEMARRYSPIAAWKHMGYYEMNIGRSLVDEIKGNTGAVGKLKELALKPAGFMDDYTLGVLWNAVSMEVNQSWEGERNTEAYNRAVGDRLSDVIDRTQVVDTVFHRPQIMRDKDGLAKMATSFMAEPIKNYNLLMDAVRSGDAGRMLRTGTAMIASGAAVAFFAGLVDGLRDRDKEKGLEGWWNSVLRHAYGIDGDFVKSNLADNLNPMGWIPGARDVYSLFQGYTPSRPDLEAVKKLNWTANNWMKYFRGEGKKGLGTLSYDTASALSTLTGLPVGSIMRDAMALFNTLNPRLIVGEGGMSQGVASERMAQAIAEGDREKALAYYNALGESGKSATALRSATVSQLKEHASIQQAAEARRSGQLQAYERGIAEAVKAGIPRDMALKAVEGLLSEGPRETVQAEPAASYKDMVAAMSWGKPVRTYTGSDLKAAALSYNLPDAKRIVDRLRQEGAKDGDIKGYFTDAFKAAYNKGNAGTRKRISDFLLQTGLGYTADSFRQWGYTLNADDLVGRLVAYDTAGARKVISTMQKEGRSDAAIRGYVSETFRDRYRAANEAGRARIAGYLKGLGLGYEDDDLKPWGYTRDYKDLYKEMDAGKPANANAMLQRFIQEGRKPSGFKATISTRYKPLYIAGSEAERQRIERVLLALDWVDEKGRKQGYTLKAIRDWLK